MIIFYESSSCVDLPISKQTNEHDFILLYSHGSVIVIELLLRRICILAQINEYRGIFIVSGWLYFMFKCSNVCLLQ